MTEVAVGQCSVMCHDQHRYAAPQVVDGNVPFQPVSPRLRISPTAGKIIFMFRRISGKNYERVILRMYWRVLVR